MKIENTTKLIVNLEHKPGSLAEVATAFANANVSIDGISLDEARADNATCYFVVDQLEKAREVLTTLKDSFSEKEIIKISCANAVGVIAKVTTALGGENVNIEKIFTGVENKEGSTVFYLDVSDADRSKAVEVLSKI